MGTGNVLRFLSVVILAASSSAVLAATQPYETAQVAYGTEYRAGSTADSARPSGGATWQEVRRGRDDDSDDFVIQRAVYGTERRQIDVTDRVRELAATDRPFRMGNSTFGTDPDPGRVKTLRVYAHGRRGRDRVFEFREGSTVDLSQFRDWRGDRGWDQRRDSDDDGEYVILRARYGTERKHVDVTDRLRELARADRTFRMGNSTFGVDPDPGRVKTLRIYARGRRGGERVFEYREGSTVDGAQFRDWRGGNWGQNRRNY